MNNEYYLKVEKHAGERNGTNVYTRFLQNGVLSAIHECQHRTINNIDTSNSENLFHRQALSFLVHSLSWLRQKKMPVIGKQGVGSQQTKDHKKRGLQQGKSRNKY